GAVEPLPSGRTWIELEADRPFGQSRLWQLQAAYYAERGIEAWRSDGVPFFATSNANLAEAYAALAAAWAEEGEHGAAPKEPQLVVELGSGSGRFAYSFLRRFVARCRPGAPPPLLYVMTDLARRNIDFWLGHPRFQEAFEAGILDVAELDASRPGSLSLERSGRTIGPGSPAFRPVVVANYFLDTLPQDLFAVCEGRLHEGRVTTVCDGDPALHPPDEVIAHLRFRYGFPELAAPPYPEPFLNRLVEEYRRQLRASCFLFPAPALRCLEALRAWSRDGLLLLAADKGQHRLEDLEGL